MLNAKQVEELLGVDASTVYRMAADGRLPAVRVGRQWRFPPDAVDRLLAAPGDGSGPAQPPVEVTTALLEAMAPALGVTMVVTDLRGRPLTRLVHPAPALAEHVDDARFLASCTREWARYAQTPHLAPRFESSAQGFLCAHSLVRHGSELVAMVLAGGIAPAEDTASGLFHLDAAGRRRVLEALPRIAAVLSRLLDHPGTGGR
jgi:excisionase family DNA binding protein